MSYSLGMALVYTALGVAAGLAGEGLAAWLQTPWVLGVFALVLVALALSMFGVYELQLPSAWTGALSQSSQRLHGGQGRTGRLAGVFAMGGVSALIVSPCVAAPLAGALVYLSQTRDVVLGGSALFSLAAGMSVPLLLLGASAGALLPRAGAWMDDVKRLFGLLLVGVAIWIVQPVLHASLALALWGALLLGVAVWLGLLARSVPAWRRALSLVAALGGALQLVGAASGGTDPLQPLAHLAGARSDSAASALRFQPVKSIAELDAALAGAKRPVMLDFYADWCVSCKEMERFTFSDPRVRARLDGALLLKADVTENDADHRALMRRFGLFGPPGTIVLRRVGPRARGRACHRLPGSRALPADLAGRGSMSAAVLESRASIAGWSSLVARWAHNPKVASSNLAPATKHFLDGPRRGVRRRALAPSCRRAERRRRQSSSSRACRVPNLPQSRRRAVW